VKYILDIDTEGVDIKFAEKFFKSISFVKNVKTISTKEITNEKILESIESYEYGTIQPTQLDLIELKKLLNV